MLNTILPKEKFKTKIMLHAYKLKFKINDIKYNFKAPYDKSFEEFIKKKYLNTTKIFNKYFY